MFIAKCTGGHVQEADESESLQSSQKPHIIEYSISVPTDEMYSHLRILDYLPPRHNVRRDLRPNVQDRYIVPLMSLQVRQLEAKGIDFELPTRRSFSDEHWQEAVSDPNSTMSHAQILRAEALPDEPVEVGYNFPAPRTFKAVVYGFCPYDEETSSEWCPPGRSIVEQLDSLNNYHDESYFQLVEIGEGHELDKDGKKRVIYGVRLGKITSDKDDPSPALFYIATQHAREWLATEVAMKIIRYFSREIRRNPSGDVAKLLKDRTLVVVPVANPDGYQHSHDHYEHDREWRKNRRDNTDVGCPLHHGVDMNRNYPVAFGQQHTSPHCYSNMYYGPEALSEPETQALKNLVTGNLQDPWGPKGSYTPIMALDVHTYGNMLLFSPGLGQSGHEGKSCTTADNCGNPDFGIFRALFKSEDSKSSLPFFQDPFWRYNHYFNDDWEEYNGKPVRWPIGTGHRTAYPAGGSLKDELMMGSFPPRVPNPIAVTLELSWWNTRPFWAELIYEDSKTKHYIDDLIENQKAMVIHFLGLLHDLDVKTGSFYPDYTRGVIERRCYGQFYLPDKEQCWSNNEPAYYKGVRNTLYKNSEEVEIVPVSGYEGETREDLKGRTHDLFQWVPENSYVFPPTITTCITGQRCDTSVLDGGDGPVKVCDQDLFPGSSQYFEGHPMCRWVLDGPVGSHIKRKKVSLGNLVGTRLQYSYKEGKKTKVKVYIKSPGKQRLVRKYPRNHPGVYESDTYSYFKTEVVDAWDFDGHEDVTVLFVVETQGSEPFLVGDVVFIGGIKP